MGKYLRFFTDKTFRFKILAARGYYNNLDDVDFINKYYKLVFNKPMNWDNPESFNEKLQWLKINNRDPKYTLMVDKYRAKDYVASIIGAEHVIPTLGVYDSFDSINFNDLPDKFVIKTTHDSGGVVICKDKSTFDVKTAKEKIERSLKRNYYYTGREWPYKDVPRCIIIEEFLEGKDQKVIDNWKFFCADGKPFLYYKTVGGGHSKDMTLTFMDMNDNKMNLIHHLYPPEIGAIELPENLQEMKMLASKLSENIPFVRVDFYDVDGNIYFGELTFFPDGGFVPYHPDGADLELGKYISIEK